MKGRIIVEEDNATMLKNNANAKKEKQILQSNATFRSWKSKIKNRSVGNAEDLDIVMSMYNLLEYVAIILWHQEFCGIIMETK